MKNFAFAFFILFISVEAFPAKDFMISIKPDTIVSVTGFHIVEVIDHRTQKEHIGIIPGSFGKKEVKVEGGLEENLLRFFESSLSSEKKGLPVKVIIKKFEVSEEEAGIPKSGFCHVILEYYSLADELLYMTDYNNEFLVNFPRRLFETAIKDLLYKSVTAFDLYDQGSHRYHDLLQDCTYCDSIILAEFPEKGFYANFREFQANNPSLKFDFEVIDGKIKGEEFATVNLQENNVPLEKLVHVIWGFSDGKNIYIRKKISGNAFTFLPVKILGKYTYIGTKKESHALPLIFPGGIIITGAYHDQDYVLDVCTGKEYELSGDNLKLLISSDYEIYRGFMQDKRSRETMKFYWIRKYNEKYRNKIIDRSKVSE